MGHSFEKVIMEEKTFLCVLPWNHLYVSTSGVLLPCCSSDVASFAGEQWHISQFKKSSDLRKVNMFKDIKQSMLEGKCPSSCSSCFNDEKESLSSYRTLMNNEYSETFDKIKEAKEVHWPIEYLDLRLGNECNLACQMCNPYSSSRLVDDFRDYYQDENYAKTAESFDWLKEEEAKDFLIDVCETVKVISFLGGEPFLIDEVWILLEDLISSGVSRNIELRFNTNMTLLPSKAFKLWKYFKSVQLIISLDGVEKEFEYIRYPGKWDKVYKNLFDINKYFNELNLSHVFIQPTIQAYNLFSLDKIINLIEEFHTFEKYPLINILVSPKHLSVDVLPDEVKKESVVYLKKILLRTLSHDDNETLNKKEFRSKLIRIIEILKNKERDFMDERTEFLRYTKWFDYKRKQSAFKVFPVLNAFKSHRECLTR
jgi:MoaA/NifB/PqqE/SkfB family radical SAM enzyme